MHEGFTIIRIDLDLKAQFFNCGHQRISNEEGSVDSPFRYRDM